MRKIFKKVIALALCMSMLTICMVKNNNSPVKAAGLGTSVLEGLVTGVASSIASHGMDAILEEFFGIEQADDVMAAFSELKDEMQIIQNQIKELSGKIDKYNLKQNLNDFCAFFDAYAVAYDTLCLNINSYSDDENNTEAFLQGQYFSDDKNSLVDSKTLINATLVLGRKLSNRIGVENYGIFGAFDLLDKFKNRWEHQGYEQRNEFRNCYIYSYAMFSLMSQLSCQAVINNPPKNKDGKSPEHWKHEASNYLIQLKEDAARVNEMVKRCAVIEHPNIRIYRDTASGKDLYFFYANVKKGFTRTPDNPRWPSLTRNAKNLSSEGFIWTLTNTTNYNTEDYGYYKIYYPKNPWPQPSSNMYHKMYEDYKADNGGKAVSLYEIFFSNKYGDFDAPSGVPKSAKFLCHNSIWYCLPFFCGWTINLSNGGAKSEEKEIISAEFNAFSSDGEILDVKYDSGIYFCPAYYYGGVKQGSLYAPEETPPTSTDSITGMASSYTLPYAEPIVLTVEKKEGYTQQWYLDAGNGEGYTELTGETGASYTLPALSSQMQGYKYYCSFIPENAPAMPTGTDMAESKAYCDYIRANYLQTDSVTLRLTGEGIPVPETEHAISSAAELSDALVRVSEGEWDNHTLRLTADVEYSAPITLTERSLTIETDGHVLTVNPSASSEPNINPMSNVAEIAAICVKEYGALTINGTLNVQASEGVGYGVYADTDSFIDVSTVTSQGGGTAVYASNYGNITVTGNIEANGDSAIGVKCVDGGTITTSGNVTVNGVGAFGVHMGSLNGMPSRATIDGNVSVSGTGSRGVYLTSENTALTINGDLTVTDGVSGIFANSGTVSVSGDVSAPNYAVNASGEATVKIGGDVSASAQNAVALSVNGAVVDIDGNVASLGQGGIGVLATESKLSDTPIGAQITINGSIRAQSPVHIETLAIDKDNFSDLFPKANYLTYTNETSVVWAKSGSFDVIPITLPTSNDTIASPTSNDAITSPQTSDTSSIWLWIVLLMISSGGAVFTIRKKRGL